MFRTLYSDFQSIESPLIPNTLLCAEPESRQYGPLNISLSNTVAQRFCLTGKGPVSTWNGTRGSFKP
jgi:hypothetical protein